MPKTSDNLVTVELNSYGSGKPLAMGRIDSTLLTFILEGRLSNTLFIEIDGVDYKYLSHKLKFSTNSIFTEASVILTVIKVEKMGE